MEILDIVKTIINTLDDKSGEEIQILHVEDLTVIADYFILATATGSTHLKALADEVEFRLKQQEILPARIEGQGTSGWILMDYQSVIVHIFTQNAREFYNLERLWGDATPLEPADFLQ